jgi:hypothetical protein
MHPAVPRDAADRCITNNGELPSINLLPTTLAAAKFRICWAKAGHDDTTSLGLCSVVAAGGETATVGAEGNAGHRGLVSTQHADFA